MADSYLTQEELNVPLRGLMETEILMFLPDKNIKFPSSAVSSNVTTLSYTTNLQSVIEFSGLPQANIATFENNSWILDGSFISPNESYGRGGDSYTGYISNDMTDDNGDYETNPILTVTLSAAATVEYLTLKFAGGIDTSYPQTLKIRTFTSSSSQINEYEIDISEQTGMPLLVTEIGDDSVKYVEFEFVGTVCPHRRTRLNKIMFGKVEAVDPDYLQDWDMDDEASLVADSIPTKLFTYTIIDFNGNYDIDNPGNKIPEDYNDVLILFTLSMEVNGVWKYVPTKTFNLLEISTSSDGLVTFSCGSLLDMLTDTYDHDTYSGTRTIETVMNSLLTFSGISIDQCTLNEFVDYEINIPLPESSVREIIQMLAFSCGATLTVDDDNKIVFSKKSIVPDSDTKAFMFSQPDPFSSAGVLIEEPQAEALDHTTNIAMYTYDTTIATETSQLGSADINTTNATRISFSAASGSIQFDTSDLESQYASISTVEEIYSQHAIISVTATSSATWPINVKVLGLATTTTQTVPKSASIDTLMLDSSLALTAPDNLKVPSSGRDETTFYYTDWYGAKYKYKCTTRNEYLVKAGDIIYLETLYSNGEASRIGYVLRNSYSYTGDTGKMEVITIDV